MTNIVQTYDDTIGPRTVVTCSNVIPLVGAAPASQLQLSLFGGPLPDGREVGMSTVPRLNRGVHYALFLDGTPWFWTPVISGMSLRVERVAGTELLLNDAGQVLTAVAPNGLHFSGPSLYPQAASVMRGPGIDEFAPPSLAVGATAPSGAVDRKVLAAAVLATLSNSGSVLTASFSPAPAANRKWNLTTALAP